MKNNYEKIMLQRTDAELIEILTKNRNDYQQEAIDAAEGELERRNLTEVQTLSAIEEMEIKEYSINEKANMPLSIYLKLLTFFFPGLPNLLIARTLKAEGYDRKWKEARRWTFLGFGFYIALFFLVFVIFIN